MNDTRRKQLNQAITLIEQAQEIINQVQSEEQESFDNLSEGLQQSEKNQRLEGNAMNLEEANNNLEDVVSNLQGVMSD